MILRFLAVLSTLLVLAACESTPDEGAVAESTGAAQSTPGAGSSERPAVVQEEMAGGTSAMTPSEELVQNVGDRVFYDFDSAVIRRDGEATLQRQAQWLRANPGVSIIIEGHADERGTREYNLALGDRRATAAKNYLVSLGVDPGRITTISYGKERPIATGHTEQAWAQNRVAVTLIR
ncbi:MAG: peptidoglycan-associated lipoprotein [Rhodospirillaceae bacterium]|nr:peptidoglycan-associated lipoprotein [Rhodospirillaceae bacterium]|tara:strand:- start:367 stop:900 length:534 start_codon:yes stop_codon:yes gene_type:complete